MEKFTFLKESTRYCTGRDFHDACQRLHQYGRDSAQEAYNTLGYFEESEEDFEVFEFATVETVTKVEPPYSR